MLKYASVSNTGNRKCNEDYVIVSDVANRQCFVVCDGLGGHGCGDVASRVAGNMVVEEFYYCEDILKYLNSSFERAQEKILVQQAEDDLKSNMKTTAVCMVADETTVYVGHVGDSRFYGFMAAGGYTRTLDHSIPQILVQAGTIEESQIRNHPSRGMLLEVLGEKSDKQLCEIETPMQLGDYVAFLLCTDGFWELIDEQQMMEALKSSESAEEWLERMVTIVEENGIGREMDNYSAIAIFNGVD